MMFQTRAFAFTFKNLSKAQLTFSTHMQTLAHDPDASELYSVEPSAGCVPAGAEQSVTVRFSPLEVQDSARSLFVHLHDLPEDAAPLRVAVSGRIQRPWCHFELPPNDYAVSGRRKPTMVGPSGDLAPLDPATVTIELESLGTGIRNTKRFFVLNPTSIPYEFKWESVPVKGQENAVSAFQCRTPQGVVSAGRRYEMAFEFTPLLDETQVRSAVQSTPLHRLHLCD